jgi:Glyoxalase-like domain
VPDLAAAGALLEALGFVPTPVSNHEVSGKPAGTANRCLMFEQGYIEILAPTLDTLNAQRVRADMARYGGIHLCCFGTPAAEAEHLRLQAHGFAPDPIVRLERKLENDKQLRFNVIYVPPEKMPEGRVQYCEHLTPQFLWHEKALAHKNGVTGLAAAYVVADDPVETAARWARFAGLLPFPEHNGICLNTARGRIFIGTRDSLSGFLYNVPAAPAIAGYALAVKDAEAFAARCAKAGLKVRKTRRHHCVALPPALGGAWLF